MWPSDCFLCSQNTENHDQLDFIFLKKIYEFFNFAVHSDMSSTSQMLLTLHYMCTGGHAHFRREFLKLCGEFKSEYAKESSTSLATLNSWHRDRVLPYGSEKYIDFLKLYYLFQRFYQEQLTDSNRAVFSNLFSEIKISKVPRIYLKSNLPCNKALVPFSVKHYLRRKTSVSNLLHNDCQFKCKKNIRVEEVDSNELPLIALLPGENVQHCFSQNLCIEDDSYDAFIAGLRDHGKSSLQMDLDEWIWRNNSKAVKNVETMYTNSNEPFQNNLEILQAFDTTLNSETISVRSSNISKIYENSNSDNGSPKNSDSHEIAHGTNVFGNAFRKRLYKGTQHTYRDHITLHEFDDSSCKDNFSCLESETDSDECDSPVKSFVTEENVTYNHSDVEIIFDDDVFTYSSDMYFEEVNCSQGYSNPCFEDSFSIFDASNKIKTVNESWQEMMHGVDDQPREPRRVSFVPSPELVKVHNFEKDDDSCSDTCMLDRIRFQLRIAEFCSIMSPFFSCEHRTNVLKRNAFYQNSCSLSDLLF